MSSASETDNVNQRAFDVVARHLLTQNAKSTNGDEPWCMYRTSGGRKCAAGALIADDKYSPTLEWQFANDEPVFAAIEASGYRGVSVELVRALQLVHDTSDVAKWPGSLASVADEYGLSRAVLNQLEVR